MAVMVTFYQFVKDALLYIQCYEEKKSLKTFKEKTKSKIKKINIYVTKLPRNTPPVKLIVFHVDAKVNNTDKAATRKAEILKIILSLITVILKVIYSIEIYFRGNVIIFFLNLLEDKD